MQVIGSIGLCNTASLNVYDVDPYGEFVHAGLNNSSPRKRKLYTNGKGSFFMFGKARYYMHDVLRV